MTSLLFFSDGCAYTSGSRTIYNRWQQLIAINVISWLKFNVPFQHKCGYIKDER